jgi:hypothetical protein
VGVFNFYFNGQALPDWCILTFYVSTTQENYMKGISSRDFPQHGGVFYFFGQALP